eukprot:jgi/Tetstr1/454203/TSEL_041122.t1
MPSAQVNRSQKLWAFVGLAVAVAVVLVGVGVALAWKRAPGGAAPGEAAPGDVPLVEAADDELADDPLDARKANPVNQFSRRPYGNPTWWNAAGGADCWTAQAATWSALPVYEQRKTSALLKSMRERDVTIVESGTGSGKTVIVPKLAHYAIQGPGGARPAAAAMVAVTNPKRITTVENADYSARLACLEPGKEIGYSHGGGSLRERYTEILYVTDGHLLSVSRSDPALERYGVVIVDEAHERTVPTDLLMGALRRAARARQEMNAADPATPMLRVVIMSATIDIREFVRWFAQGALSVGAVRVQGAPNRAIERRREPQSRAVRHLEWAVEVVMRIATNRAEPRGDILVFVPLTADTAGGCEILSEACRRGGLRCTRDVSDESVSLRCLRLFSSVSEGEKQAALRGPANRDRTRNVVFSTNVAESSITLKTLSHVVDTGLVLRVKYDADTDSTELVQERVTRAESEQRAGRVGRNTDGVAYLMYDERKLKAQYPIPSILTTNITQHMLDSTLGYGAWEAAAAEAGDLLTPPTAAQLDAAWTALRFYGLVDEAGRPTHAGVLVSEMLRGAKVSFDDALLLTAGCVGGAIRDTSRAVACGENNGYQSWLDALAAAGGVPARCGASDHVTSLRVFQAVVSGLAGDPRADALRARAEQLEAAASEVALRVAESPLPWPWSVLAASRGGGAAADAAACSAPPNVALEIGPGDGFLRAVAAAGIMHASRNGKRVFRPSLRGRGSFSTDNLQRAIHVGNGYRKSASGRGASFALMMSTAFTEGALQGLLSTRPRAG